MSSASQAALDVWSNAQLCPHQWPQIHTSNWHGISFSFCRVWTWERGGLDIAHMVAHNSPVWIRPFSLATPIWTLSLQRTSQERKEAKLGKSSQRFTLQYSLSLIRQNIQKGRKTKSLHPITNYFSNYIGKRFLIRYINIIITLIIIIYYYYYLCDLLFFSGIKHSGTWTLSLGGSLGSYSGDTVLLKVGGHGRVAA